MKRYSITIAAMLALIASAAHASGGTPKFIDYPVAHIYKGKHGPVKPEADDSPDFKWQLKQTLKGRVNFAGHYIVFTYDCGTACITGSIVDVISGEVVDGFPDGYVIGDDSDSFSADYRANSHLLIITGISGSDVSDSPRPKTRCFVMGREKLKEISCR